ncbi:MAG: CNNM domain-containing protein [Deltaproteobacteria bacterium]|nr:CNNM domain-containing protein [Deltaproteobacteria bacterium]
MKLLLIYLFTALGLSFLCSLLESALLSVTPGFMGAYEKKAPITGRLLNRLKKDIDRPLAAILSLNTIAHTVGAAGVGAQSMVIFGSEYVAITSSILTLLILVLTEIIPKTYGAIYWRGDGPVYCPNDPHHDFPALSSGLSRMTLTRLISKGKKQHSFSRDEFQAIADIGIKEGKFREEESRVIRNLFLLRKLSADDIMTPRTVLFTLPASMTVGEAVKIPDIKFTRIPIYQDDPDHIVGFVLRGDIYLEVSRGYQAKPLIALRRDLTAVPETVTLIHLYERFLKQRQQAVLVVDEHGGVAGILTMEDIIETLLGIEIMDETDTVAICGHWPSNNGSNVPAHWGS